MKDRRCQHRGGVAVADAILVADQQTSHAAWVRVAVTGGIVLAILWLALRSLRLVVAAVINLAVGLVITSAGGIVMVGALNPISLAFADNASNGIEPAYSWRYRRRKRMPDDSMKEFLVEDHAHRVFRHLHGLDEDAEIVPFDPAAKPAPGGAPTSAPNELSEDEYQSISLPTLAL